MTASAASAYPPTAAWPHSRCRGSVLNSATPPANRAEANSPALSQAQGMVVTDCQTPGLVAPVPPSTPVVGASSRLSRLSTRDIVRSACLPHVIRADDLPSSARLSRTEGVPVTNREQDPAEPVGGEFPQPARGDQGGHRCRRRRGVGVLTAVSGVIAPETAVKARKRCPGRRAV